MDQNPFVGHGDLLNALRYRYYGGGCSAYCALTITLIGLLLYMQPT